MKIHSMLRKMGAGIAGVVLLAMLLGFATLRVRESDPRLAVIVVLGGPLAIALVGFSAAIVGRDLAAQQKTELALKELAMVDELTGLYNRRGFMAHATDVLRLAE